MATNPNFTAPLAPPAQPAPTGVEPAPSADEGAMQAGLGAGPQAGPSEHASMTRPSHNISSGPSGGHRRSKSQASEPAYGPATSEPY